MPTSTKLVSAVALVGVLICPSSVFAEVFKCIDEATGKMTFTDVACPDKGTGDYVPVKSANGDSGYPSAADGLQRQSQIIKSTTQPTSPTTSRQNEVAGYECSGGGRTWVSRTPCPATTHKATPVSISGPGSAGLSGTIWEDVPVNQESLEKRDYCNKSKQLKPDSGASIYERNKMRCARE